MQAELAKQIHTQLLRTFRYKSRRGYCWLLAKFGDTDLVRLTDERGQEMLRCLEAKEWGLHCPTHQRVHEGRGADKLNSRSLQTQ